MGGEKQNLVICYQWKTESGAVFTHLHLHRRLGSSKGANESASGNGKKTQPWQSSTRGTNVKQVDDIMWDK